MILMAEK